MMKASAWICLAMILLICLPLAESTSKYRVSRTTKDLNSVALTLTYFGTDDFYLKETSPIVKQLKFQFHSLTFNDFNIRITDNKKTRFQVPQGGPFATDPLKNFSFPMNLAAFRLDYTEDPFDFKVVRRFNNATLFSSYQGELIYSDYYLEITTELDTQYTYGLGERFNSGFRLRDGKWTIFNRDRGEIIIDKGTGLQTYGFYPFYMQRENEKFFHVNYLRSSNAMDVIKRQANNKHLLTYKVIGGIFDFRFILAEQSAEALLDKLSVFMGRSAVPPFWSLGFHQSRWGYHNVSMLENVIQNYEANGIPLDTIWSDIDYLLDYQDFTIDESRFPLDRMKAILNKYHYIPIIEPGIAVNNGTAYTEGVKRGVFVKDAKGEELHGRVWPGTTTFVDFFHPNATKYWGDMLDILYSKIKFSGVWLDMNEYANFCDGPCEPPSGPVTFDFSKDLPYTPGSDGIEAKTIPLNSTRYGNLKEADVHAFSALMETYATNQFLKSKDLRPFIITRSSTLGSNKWGFHWTGDNYASFEFLRSSITDNFLNQMWGFQMVGPDICGFGGNTTAELCARWFQLATLYPFARSHNIDEANDQQPYALGDTVLQAAKNNLKLRYSLLKHYYSIFIGRRGLGTIYNPLFFIFPLDSNNYVDEIAQTQFLVGTNLMAAPILEEGQTSRNVYFTTANWFDLYTGAMYLPGTANIANVQLTDRLPLFLRQGSMILMQDTDDVTSTRDLDNSFMMVAGFHFDKNRSGQDRKVYEAVGSHISIYDYNDNTRVSLCLSEGCEYTFNLVLEVTGSARTLNVKVGYAGGLLLNNKLVVTGVTVMYDGIMVVQQLEEPFEISGPFSANIPINDPGDIPINDPGDIPINDPGDKHLLRQD